MGIIQKIQKFLNENKIDYLNQMKIIITRKKNNKRIRKK